MSRDKNKATVQVPETLFSIMNMLETTFVCENKVSSKALAVGSLMKSQNEALNFTMSS